jgi:regulator of cell morphogenesis and NO signaling
VRIFEQLGFDYWCDCSREFADSCHEKGLDTAAVRAQIEHENREAAGETNWKTAPLSELIAHIVATHHEYLRRELPVLSERIDKVSNTYAERELLLHMRKEEMMLLPAIQAYEEALPCGSTLPPTPFGPVANPIGMMKFEHNSAATALKRMRELTSGYSVPSHACPTYRALFEGLQAFEACLHLHMHLESNILSLRAITLEPSADSSSTGSLEV